MRVKAKKSPKQPVCSTCFCLFLIFSLKSHMAFKTKHPGALRARGNEVCLKTWEGLATSLKCLLGPGLLKSWWKNTKRHSSWLVEPLDQRNCLHLVVSKCRKCQIKTLIVLPSYNNCFVLILKHQKTIPAHVFKTASCCNEWPHGF